VSFLVQLRQLLFLFLHCRCRRRAVDADVVRVVLLMIMMMMIVLYCCFCCCSCDLIVSYLVTAVAISRFFRPCSCWLSSSLKHKYVLVVCNATRDFFYNNIYYYIKKSVRVFLGTATTILVVPAQLRTTILIVLLAFSTCTTVSGRVLGVIVHAFPDSLLLRFEGRPINFCTALILGDVLDRGLSIKMKPSKYFAALRLVLVHSKVLSEQCCSF
jgi:hypothetical protein